MKGKDRQVVIFDRRESLADSIKADLLTFGLILACIYASLDSVIWTLAMVFMLGLFAVTKLIEMRRKVFGTKAQLQAWIDSLPDDTSFEVVRDSDGNEQRAHQ